MGPIPDSRCPLCERQILEIGGGVRTPRWVANVYACHACSWTVYDLVSEVLKEENGA